MEARHQGVRQRAHLVAGWFRDPVACQSESYGNIGRITADGAITEYPVPTAGSDLSYGITAGPDGALWFTESSANKIGRITTNGVITEYPVPTTDSTPGAITAGLDGALWFTEPFVKKLGRITISGEITEYSVRTSGNLAGITTGPDGALWFLESSESQNRIGRITTTGAVTQYLVPTSNALLAGITRGPDGALWFTENDGAKIGRITTTGIITEYSTGFIYPTNIAAGPDGDLWFTQWGNNIGRAKACGLGLNTSFANRTLTMNFDLGIDRAAIWSVSAGSKFSLNRPIPAVVPPRAFTLHWAPFSNTGDMIVKSALSDESGQVLCEEWTTVNTGQ